MAKSLEEEMIYEDFRKQLKEFCSKNWKAKRIMDFNGNDFEKLPRYQQQMFMKEMGVEEITFTKTLRREGD